MNNFIRTSDCVGVICIPVLWLHREIYNFVWWNFFAIYVCTLPSINFKTNSQYLVRLSRLIYCKDLLKNKIANVLWWKVLF